MQSSLVRFSALLRARGIRISPPETMDAAGALVNLGLRDRETVKIALRATLVKAERDVPLFDELFEAFFTVSPLPKEKEAGDAGEGDDATPSGTQEADAPDLDDDPSGTKGELTELGQFFDEPEDDREKLQNEDGDGAMPGTGSDELLIGEAQDEGGEADFVLHLDRVSDPGAPGEMNFDEGTPLEAELDADAMHAHHLPMDAVFDEQELDELRRQANLPVEDLAELLRKHLEKLKALEAPVEATLDPLVAKHARFTEEERHRMDALLRRTARELRGAPSPRREVRPRGRLAAGRTMRAALRTGGVPFKLVNTQRKDDQPRLVVIVDISLSVRNTARFTLHLVAGLAALFSRVRTFAFVADLVEVTDLLARDELETALAKLFGGDVIDVDANSNYGRPFETFYEEFRGIVDRRTTVVILGDGRGNRNPPQAWALEEIARRARHVVWLTPEPERHWPYGASDMEQYAELCDRVEVVRDLDGLEDVAGSMLMPRRGERRVARGRAARVAT